MAISKEFPYIFPSQIRSSSSNERSTIPQYSAINLAAKKKLNLNFYDKFWQFSTKGDDITIEIFITALIQKSRNFNTRSKNIN